MAPPETDWDGQSCAWLAVVPQKDGLSFKQSTGDRLVGGGGLMLDEWSGQR